MAPRTYQGQIVPDQRRTDFAKLDPQLEDQFVDAVVPSISEFFGVSLSKLEGQSALVYRYPEGVGFVAHHDEPTEIEIERSLVNGQPVVQGDLTVVLFLNDPEEYEGGDLFFEDPDVSYRPPCGSIVVFPATRRWVHGVRRITSGVRWSVILRFGIQAADQ